MEHRRQQGEILKPTKSGKKSAKRFQWDSKINSFKTSETFGSARTLEGFSKKINKSKVKSNSSKRPERFGAIKSRENVLKKNVAKRKSSQFKSPERTDPTKSVVKYYKKKQKVPSVNQKPNASFKADSAESSQKFFEHKKQVAKVKHEVLYRYLGSWMAILSRNRYRFGLGGYSKLVFVDGFAGPGIYNDNEDGSPAMAYKLALTHTNLGAKVPDIYLIFVEKSQNDCKLLLKNLRAIKKEHKDAKNATKVKFMVIQGEFAKAMDWIMSKAFQFPTDSMQRTFTVPEEHLSADYGRQFITPTTPLMVFADPFGYSGKTIPMTTMRDIMNISSKSEILLNLMTGSIRRFFKLDSRAKAINLLVGVDEEDSYWKPIVLAEKSKVEGLKRFLQIYDDKMAELCKRNVYTSLFWMRDQRNVLIYNLYSVSQHQMGFKQMKTAMQKASQSEKTFKFSAFDAKKQDFEIERVTVDEMEKQVKAQFRGKTVSGQEISNFIDYNTANLHQKFRSPLKRKLEDDCVSPNKSKRQKFDRMVYSFPEKESDDTSSNEDLDDEYCAEDPEDKSSDADSDENSSAEYLDDNNSTEEDSS